MDTKSYYVNSPIDSLNYIAVGWSWNLSQIPYLYWGGGSGAPTAFQAWEKSCEDTLAFQGGLYQWALTQFPFLFI